MLKISPTSASGGRPRAIGGPPRRNCAAPKPSLESDTLNEQPHRRLFALIGGSRWRETIKEAELRAVNARLKQGLTRARPRPTSGRDGSRACPTGRCSASPRTCARRCAAPRGAGEPAALVTLYRVEGGGPRPPGTQMVFADGLVAGFLSGGCVEGDVAIHAARDAGGRRAAPAGLWRRRPLAGHPAALRRADRDPGRADRARRSRPPPGCFALTRRPRAGGLEHRRPRAKRRGGSRAPRASSAWPPTNPSWSRGCTSPCRSWRWSGADPTALAIACLGAQAGFETTLVRPKGPIEPPPLAGVAYSRDEPAEALAARGPRSLDRRSPSPPTTGRPTRPRWPRRCRRRPSTSACWARGAGCRSGSRGLRAAGVDRRRHWRGCARRSGSTSAARRPGRWRSR